MARETESILTTERERRMLVGLAVQPFVAAAVGCAIFPLVDYTGGLVYGGRALNRIEAAIHFSILCGVIVSFLTGVIAYPAVSWLLKRGLHFARKETLIAGLALGNVPGVLVVLAIAAGHLSRGVTPTFANVTYGHAGALRLAAFGTIMGVTGAAVFWYLAGRRLSTSRPPLLP